MKFGWKLAIPPAPNGFMGFMAFIGWLKFAMAELNCMAAFMTEGLMPRLAMAMACALVPPRPRPPPGSMGLKCMGRLKGRLLPSMEGLSSMGLSMGLKAGLLKEEESEVVEALMEWLLLLLLLL